MLSICFSYSVNAQDIYNEIALAIQSGNSKEVSKFFQKNVELTIIDKEDMYSSAQAEVILKDFFAKNPPVSFKLIHQGQSNEGSKYGIGNYVTKTSKQFRTYFYIKQVSGKFFIHELRFEEEK